MPDVVLADGGVLSGSKPDPLCSFERGVEGDNLVAMALFLERRDGFFTMKGSLKLKSPVTFLLDLPP